MRHWTKSTSVAHFRAEPPQNAIHTQLLSGEFNMWMLELESRVNTGMFCQKKEMIPAAFKWPNTGYFLIWYKSDRKSGWGAVSETNMCWELNQSAISMLQNISCQLNNSSITVMNRKFLSATRHSKTLTEETDWHETEMLTNWHLSTCHPKIFTSFDIFSCKDGANHFFKMFTNCWLDIPHNRHNALSSKQSIGVLLSAPGVKTSYASSPNINPSCGIESYALLLNWYIFLGEMCYS